jgi:hypothetical protein
MSPGGVALITCCAITYSASLDGLGGRAANSNKAIDQRAAVSE